MSFLKDLINPPASNPSQKNQYDFDNNVFTNLNALQYIMNPSVIDNANFSNGGTLITQADGDNAEFFTDWFVVGASVATYTLTPQNYAANSTIQSMSPTYSGVVVSGYSTSGLYFYQRQVDTVRGYQKNYFSYGLIINNNQTKAIKVGVSIFSFYNPSSTEKSAGAFYLQPGLNTISSASILTDSLSGISVGANPYTEFRFRFLDLVDGTADINIYQIKCEFGTVSTLLGQ